MLSFPHDFNDLLPAQVPRSARRRSTSRLHERARHVWRRGTVHSSLWCLLEGYFRSLSTELHLKDFDRCVALGHEQWGVRHDLYARVREMSQKFEGVEPVDVETLPRRVRRENPDITSPPTKTRVHIIKLAMTSNCASVQETTSLFARPPVKKSGVREHTPYSRCSSRTTRTRTKIKHAQMTTKPAFLVAFGCT